MPYIDCPQKTEGEAALGGEGGRVSHCGNALWPCCHLYKGRVGKGAAQPAHFLIFKPGAGRGKVELLHQHLPAVSALGVLLRKVETGIRGISHVIVDEIHERDINVSQS